MKAYTVYLFSNDPRDTKPLWTKDFRAKDADDADEVAVKLVSPQLRKFPTAEDWAVYEKGQKRAKTDPAEELAIRFLLAEDMVEQDGKAKLAAITVSPDALPPVGATVSGYSDMALGAVDLYFDSGDFVPVHVASTPKPPHGGQRAEKLVDKTDKHALWRTGGVQGQMTKMWVITDHTGRYLEVGGRPSGYQKKGDAMDAWGEVKKGNFKMTRAAKTNAKVVEVPNTFHAVNLEPPKKVRKEFPFEGFIDFQGIQIDVENVKGGTRSGTGPEGDWSTFMHAHYGEIRGTEGTDGDMLDVYVGDNHDSSIVVVIHQHNPWDGAYDEDKVVIGCESVEESIGLYKKQYDRPGFFLKDEYTAMPIGAFWRWVKDTRNKGKRVKAAQQGQVYMPDVDDPRRVWNHIGGDLEGSFDGAVYVDIRSRGGDGHIFVSRAALLKATELFGLTASAIRTAATQQRGSTLRVAVATAAPMWKRGYVEMKPGAINDARDRTFTVLALLRALAWSHQASHWQISGDSSYGDHQLFDRIYGPILGETDALAEKLVGTFGPSAVDAAWQVEVVAKFVTALSDIDCPFERALHGERVFQVVLKNAVEYLEGLDQLSLGLDDFLRTLANNHETTLYLLQQRHGGVRVASATASPKQVARRRVRAFTARCILMAAGSVQPVPGKPTSKMAPHTVRQNVHGDKKWYPVSGKGVWALEGYPTAADAVKAAKGIREIKSDGKEVKMGSTSKEPDRFLRAAEVGTDTASILAIAPEQLEHLIDGGRWAEEMEASNFNAADLLVRQHGGAVFHTGGDGTWDVEVPGAVSGEGLMEPYGTEGYSEAIKKLADHVMLAMEFPTDEARSKYLKEHPGAKPSSHTVSEGKKPEGKDEGESKGDKPSGKWDPAKADEYAKDYDPSYDYKGKIDKAKGEAKAIKGRISEVKSDLTKKIRGNSDLAKIIGDAKDSDITFKFKKSTGGDPDALVMSIKGKPYPGRLNISTADARKLDSYERMLDRNDEYEKDMAGEWAWGHPGRVHDEVRQRGHRWPDAVTFSRLAHVEKLADQVLKTAGWWAIGDQSPGGFTSDGGMVPPPVDKGGLMNAIPGVDGADDALYNGDGPADVMDDTIADIDLLYRQSWGRGIKTDELQAVFDFCSGPFMDGRKSNELNPWVDLVAERQGMTQQQVVALDWDALQAMKQADITLRNAPSNITRLSSDSSPYSPQSLAAFDKRCRAAIEGSERR